jgi:hypothetical protein
MGIAAVTKKMVREGAICHFQDLCQAETGAAGLDLGKKSALSQGEKAGEY